MNFHTAQFKEAQHQNPADASRGVFSGSAHPHNIEAEQALLGAILMNNDAMEHVSEFLHPSHFYEPLHARIFDVCMKQITAGRRATPITIKSTFDGEPLIDKLTVPQYLGRLIACATSVVNAGDYGRTIFDLALRRELIGLGEEISACAQNAAAEDTPEEQIQWAEKRLFDLGQTGHSSTEVHVSRAAMRVIETTARVYQSGTGLSGVSTGIACVDFRLGGLEPGNLLIIGGRPGMGKSAIAANIAKNVAANGIPVMFFSLEMTEEELTRRIISTEAGVPASDMRRGNLTQEQFMKIEEAAHAIGRLPLYFDACAGLTPQQLKSRARRAVRKYGVGLFLLDYVQLMHVPGITREYDRLTEASNSLKPLASDLRVPMVALAQLSRACEQREDKRPMLSDLRGTGSLEQDADMVAFMYREEYYREREEPDPADKGYSIWQDRMRNCKGKAEFILAKGRHGPTGTAILDFNASLSLFYDEVLP